MCVRLVGSFPLAFVNLFPRIHTDHNCLISEVHHLALEFYAYVLVLLYTVGE